MTSLSCQYSRSGISVSNGITAVVCLSFLFFYNLENKVVQSEISSWFQPVVWVLRTTIWSAEITEMFHEMNYRQQQWGYSQGTMQCKTYIMTMFRADNLCKGWRCSFKQPYHISISLWWFSMYPWEVWYFITLGLPDKMSGLIKIHSLFCEASWKEVYTNK